MSSSPHDSLFKETFSQLEHAQGLIRSLLPKAITDRMDFTTLTLRPGSYIDQTLTPSQSDLLFSIRMDGQRVLIYVLLEHQSSVDGLMSFRLLQYMIRIWSEYLTQNPNAKQLPVILPVVFYHGDRSWNAPTSLQELYTLDADALQLLGKYVPQFSFVLDDVTCISNEFVQRRPMTALSKLTVVVLRDARHAPDLALFLRQWNDFIDTLAWTDRESRLVKSMVYYIFAAMDRFGADTIVETFQHEVRTAPKELIMNAAEELMQRGFEKGIETGLETGFQKGRQEGIETGLRKGRQEGKQEGRLEGQRSTVRKLLQLRFRTVPSFALEHIEHASLEQLECWTERILTAASVHDVFADS